MSNFDSGGDIVDSSNRRQNYVSSELTHFVGRSLMSDDDRYALFVDIIKTGLIRGKVDNGKGSTIVNVDPGVDFSSNDSYNVNMVCFCDIPIADFEIHMSKYSHFGLAFSKDFLIQRGARPVHYIPKDSISVNQKLTDMFNTVTKEIRNLNMEIMMAFMLNIQNGQLQNQGQPYPYFNGFHFMDMQLLSFIKFYDHNKTDDDIDNFYMEREWRSLERIEFQLEDIKRIVIPSSYIMRFFQEFPNYNSYITTV
jgi:hypothetical protein